MLGWMGVFLGEIQFGIALLFYCPLQMVHFRATLQPIPRSFKAGRIVHDVVHLSKHSFYRAQQPIVSLVYSVPSKHHFSEGVTQCSLNFNNTTSCMEWRYIYISKKVRPIWTAFSFKPAREECWKVKTIGIWTFSFRSSLHMPRHGLVSRKTHL